MSNETSDNELDSMAATAAEERNEQNEQEIAADYMVCPCCGKPTLRKPVVPNQRLVDHWLSCMVTGVPFSHAYPIYGGRIVVTVTRLTAQQAESIDRLTSVVDMLFDQKWETGMPPVSLDQLRAASRLFMSIQEISTPKAGTVRTFHPQDEVLACVDALVPHRLEIAEFRDLDAWVPVLKDCYARLTNPDLVSAVPTQVLMAVLSTHSRVNDILMSVGFDENFWEGIEMA